VTGRTVPASPTVRYLDLEPNGIAALLGALLEANLIEHPELRRFLSPPAAYVVEASDVGVAATIRVAPEGIRIQNGRITDPDVAVEGTSALLVGLSSVPLRLGLPDVMTAEGRSVVRNLLARRMHVKGLVRHPGKLGRLTRLLSVNERIN
jgi:hypothetical protein